MSSSYLTFDEATRLNEASTMKLQAKTNMMITFNEFEAQPSDDKVATLLELSAEMVYWQWEYDLILENAEQDFTDRLIEQNILYRPEYKSQPIIQAFGS